MKTNKQEYNLLNGKPARTKRAGNTKKTLFNIFYYIAQTFLWVVYIITYIFCTIIEIIFFTFTFRKRRKLKRRARWLI